MRFNLVTILLFAAPLSLSAPTRVSQAIHKVDARSPIYELDHVNQMEVRQAAGTTPVPAPAATPPPTAPDAAAPAATSSATDSMIAEVVHDIWPAVDPIIEEVTISIASYIPTLLSGLFSSWGL